MDKRVATRRVGVVRRGHDQEGFTIIELMVVVLIIGILIGIALPTFLGARTHAEDRAATSELRTGLAAALTYYAEFDDWGGFDATTAEVAESNLAWIDGGDPLGNEISIEVNSGTNLLLVRRSVSGTYFCVAQLATNPATQRGSGATFADVDTIAECDGGW